MLSCIVSRTPEVATHLGVRLHLRMRDVCGHHDTSRGTVSEETQHPSRDTSQEGRGRRDSRVSLKNERRLHNRLVLSRGRHWKRDELVETSGGANEPIPEAAQQSPREACRNP